MTKEILLFGNYAGNEAERLVPDLSLFFKKMLNTSLKQRVCSLALIYFDSSQLGATIKTNCVKH